MEEVNSQLKEDNDALTKKCEALETKLKKLEHDEQIYLKANETLQQRVNTTEGNLAHLSKICDKIQAENIDEKIKITDGVIDEWTKSQSMEVALELRYGLGFTWEQYNGLRMSTGFQFDALKNIYARKKIALPYKLFYAPCLPCQQLVLHRAREIAGTYGIHQIPEGATISVDQATVTALQINGNWRDVNGKHHLQFCVDAMKMFRRGHVTNFAIRSFNSDQYYNSLTSMCILGVVRGKDEYDNLQTIASSVNQHISSNLDNETWWTGGDMVALCNLGGLSASFGSTGCNCAWCFRHSNDLHIPGSADSRTLRLMYHCSHLPFPADNNQFPFTCPSGQCGKIFLSQEDVDNDSSTMSPNVYAKTHYGCVHKRKPLVDIDPSRWIMCVLHLLLSVTKKLFHLTIVKEIQSTEKAFIITDFIKGIGVCMPDLKSTLHKESMPRSLSFTGQECVTIIENSDTLIDMVHNEGTEASVKA